MFKAVIPASIWQHYTCLIVHPGIKGDRGPSSLDWAILNGYEEWGVTVLQADADMDAGAIWASRPFAMRDGSKSHLYRHEVTEAAIEALLEAIDKFESKTFVPEPLDYSRHDVKGRWQASMKQADRAIDWRESTASILRKIRCADSFPGVFDTVLGMPCYLYGAHEDDVLRGTPGKILGTRHGAICRATGDGAVWITHLKHKRPDGEPSFKLPATQVLGDRLIHVPEIPVAIDFLYHGRTYREIWYEERQEVGYLHFDVLQRSYEHRAVSTACEKRSCVFACDQRKCIVLMGGTDFWSNGIHLNMIEAADDPAYESWRNIQAMDDLVRDIHHHRLPPGDLCSARQCSGRRVSCWHWRETSFYGRAGIVLNPHYKGMGNLYGSEYWTYLLPKRVGAAKARELTEALLPISTSAAQRIGLLDDAFGEDAASFREHIRKCAEELASSNRYEQPAWRKSVRGVQHDEARKPLHAYREEELQQMWLNFFGADHSYHLARKHFVYKGILPARERCNDVFECKSIDMAKILDGRAMSEEIKAQVRAEVRRFVEEQGRAPGLAMVRVEGDAASLVYSKAIVRMAEQVGIHCSPRTPTNPDVRR